MDVTEREIKHYGVLGMRWGRRSGHQTNLNSERDFKSDHQKKLDKQEKLLVEMIKKKKIRSAPEIHEMNKKQIAEILSSSAMQKKIKNYESEKQVARVRKAARIVGLSIFAISAFGPSFYRSGGKLYKFAQDKRAADLLNKYGGFDPSMVINSKFIN